MRRKRMLALAAASVIALCAGIVVMLTMITPAQDDGVPQAPLTPSTPAVPQKTDDLAGLPLPPVNQEDKDFAEIERVIEDNRRLQGLAGQVEMDWIVAASWINQACGDKEVEDAAVYVASAVPCLPGRIHDPVPFSRNAEREFRDLNLKRPNRVAILKDDRSPRPLTASILGYGPYPAGCMSSNKTIVLDGRVTMSALWKGLLAIRAARHAQETWHEILTPAELAVAETKALLLQHRMMAKMAGKEYAEAVRHQALVWLKAIEEKKVTAMDALIGKAEVKLDLDPVVVQKLNKSFAVPASEDELAWRERDVRLAVAFALLTEEDAKVTLFRAGLPTPQEAYVARMITENRRLMNEKK